MEKFNERMDIVAQLRAQAHREYLYSRQCAFLLEWMQKMDDNGFFYRAVPHSLAARGQRIKDTETRVYLYVIQLSNNCLELKATLVEL